MVTNKRIWFIAVIIVAGLGLGGWLGLISSKIDRPTHKTYFDHQTDFFDAAYEYSPDTPKPDSQIKGILVNHHLLAANLIAQAFNLVATADEMTVILISPDHFDASAYQIITSNGSWQTPCGKVWPNMKLINTLVENKLITIKSEPFNKDHGISNIIPFIHRSLPRAKIIPIIFSNQIKLEEAISWSDQVTNLIGDNVLVVASADMSHAVSEDIALVQDKLTIEAISDMDITSISKRPIDSPIGLSAWTQIMQNLKADQWHLLARSSSALLSDSKNPLDNTSYITGYFASN